MSVLSVPLTAELENAIAELIKMGYASNKADAARKAILQIQEEEAINVVLKGRQEIKDGKLLSGDLEALVNQI
ncbi:MAG: hypothetical protein OEL89_03470 [Candidatus Peregrinibacteria bacterium]|nr:hypothetical protein [Candidatus Peregrinibacteria bacterium]